MERIMHQLSVLCVSISIGLFFVTTASVEVKHRNIAQFQIGQNQR